MAALPPPFGHEEEASLSGLREFFCRCLRKGRWELARACLPQLSRGPDAAEVEEILRGLVKAPELLSCDEEHTPQRLAWFWSNALEVWLGWAHKRPPDILKDETEFLLLLEEFQNTASEQAVKELHDAFLYSHSEIKESKRESPSPRFSDVTVSALWGTLSQNPRLVQSIVGFLLVDDAHPADAEYNRFLLNITVNFLLDLLPSLQKEDEAGSPDGPSASPTAGQIYSVLSTMHFNMDLQAGELRRLCETLYDICSDKGILSEDQVQASLLRKQNYGLVGLYGTVSTEKIKARVGAMKSPGKGATQELGDTEKALLALFYDREQADPWKKIYFYSVSTGKHFLEQILLTALALLKKEDFSGLDTLLSNEFMPLRSLLVLLGWPHLQSTESAKSLLQVMHKDTDLFNDSLLKDFCDGLKNQVESLEWCLEHSRQEISKKDVLHHLCTLDSHSALYILHHLTNLPQLNEDEVLKLLRRGLPEEGSTERDDLQEQRQYRNIVVFQAFCAMKYAIYAVCASHAQCKDYHATQPSSLPDGGECGKSSEQPNLFVQYLTKCQYYLYPLPMPLKLELLENLFSLMFTSVADLRSEPPAPESSAVEEAEQDSGQKASRLDSLDSSTDKGESTLVTSQAMESSQHSSVIVTDKSNTAEGSTQCASDTPQNNLWDLVGSNYIDLKNFTSSLSGFLVDEVVLDSFLKMLKEQVDLIKDSIHTSDLGEEPTSLASASEDFKDRVSQLSEYISEAQWRYKVVMSNRNADYEHGSARLQMRTYKTASIKRRRRPKRSRSRKQTESTSSELSTSESSVSNLSAKSDMDSKGFLQQRNNLIPMMLSPPESLLISCILRGNYADAHEVSRRFNLQSSPSHGELVYMERYQEVVRELSKVEKKMENQTADVGTKKPGSKRSTLQAIGNAAAAGMVCYSISDVTDKLVAPAECQIPALQEDYWLRCARLDKTDKWRHMVEEMNPAAMAAFDLACTQAHLWKTCKQLLETAQRHMEKCLQSKGRTCDMAMEHPEGIRGVQAILQQMSEIINYPCLPRGQTEIEEKISAQLKCNIKQLLHTCYSVLNDEHLVRHITLSHKLEENIAQLKSAITSLEPKGNLIQSLMDQLSLKTQDVQNHPVRTQMSLLLNNLDELTELLDKQGSTFKPVHSFFTYMDTLAKVITQSINPDLESSSELKVANPFVLLQQKPSQVVSHLLFERQVSPERLSTLLKKEDLDLNVEQVIADHCCSNLSLSNTRKENQAQGLLHSITQLVQQCVDVILPNVEIALPVGSQDSEDTASSSPSSPSESNQYGLTASALNFLKSKSPLNAVLACLSATKGPKPAKSGLSWMELRGKKESPLDMDTIAKECDALMADYPILKRYIDEMSAPFRESSQDVSGSLCGKPYAATVLIGLHAPSAPAVITETFQDLLSKKNWKSALELLNLYMQDFDLKEVRDAVRCCAAAEEKEGWQYLFAVKDATLRSRMALHLVDKWPMDPCWEILSYCVSEPHIDDSLRQELKTKRKELNVYKKILGLREDAAWACWQDLKEDCTKDPQTIISLMLDAKDYLLCEDWALFYQIPTDLQKTLYRQHLLNLLGTKDTEGALQLLKRVEDKDLRLAITEQALLQNPGIFASHFLSEYLLAHFSNSLVETNCDDVRNLFLGSKILLALPETAHSDYDHLLTSPLLMLEQLLMNMKIEWASVAVLTLRPHAMQPDFALSIEDVDRLLSMYAGKALEIPFAFREKRTDNVCLDSVRVPENTNQPSDSEHSSSPPSSSGEPTSSSIVDRSRTEKGHRRKKSSTEFIPPEKPPAKTQWIPDQNEVTCMVCKNERFTMFNRRHHCRRCGRLVCSACSMKRMVVEGCRENPARVCDQCHNYFCADANKTEEDVEQSEEKTGGTLDLSEVLKLSKAAEVQWWLTLNEAENEVERSDFYYEQAPSASLSSAILNLHSKTEQCGFQLITLCCELSRGLNNPEMDTRLLLDIMKRLLFGAKMIFVKAGRNHDLSVVDGYSSKVDLLKILVAANYRHVPSLEELVRPAAVVRLRNRLLEAEYYTLAIEVSTKAGLDPSGVWQAWGMACLEAGYLPEAREKLSRCLKPPLDLNQKHIGSKLLKDIIDLLEAAARPLMPDEGFTAFLKELEATLKTDKLSFGAMPDEKIQNNKYYQECLYYLHTYGTHLGIIQFYMRRDLMRDALLHLLNKECPGEIFIEGIFLRSCKKGKLLALENMLESIDPTLESWSPYLIATCKHLQRKNHFNTLYEIQQFMKDHVRAAITCTRFFSHKAKNYRDLGNNQAWLAKSKDHLKIYLQEVSRSNRKKSFDTFRKKMSATDVSRHINTVELQMEITKFLQRCESLHPDQVYNTPPPTLFGDSAMMMEVPCRVILSGKNVEEGFGIAFRVIQDFQLDAFKVYSEVCRQLIQQENYAEILQLVKCVSESGVAAETDCDMILLRCVEQMTDVSSDELSKLIDGMKNEEIKIKAYLACRMMRSAYLAAVELEHERAIQVVKEVGQVAHNNGDRMFEDVCAQWIVDHPLGSKPTPRPTPRK